ncbi:hypothetical protein CF336_g7887 [Tilletia laevis]|nr:hypothetical protein CF336_g7887 [Tilletia laevis]
MKMMLKKPLPMTMRSHWSRLIVRFKLAHISQFHHLHLSACPLNLSVFLPQEVPNCQQHSHWDRMLAAIAVSGAALQHQFAFGTVLSITAMDRYHGSSKPRSVIADLVKNEEASVPTCQTFCLTIQHAYEQHAPGTRLKFLHRSTFVKLYFAYISLQQLDVDFSCQLCGPTPSIVIADGVVLAYNASFRLAELSPPTTTGSDINDSVRSGSITPFLPIPAARAALKQLAEVLVSDPDQCLQPLQQLKIAVDDAKAMAPILRLWVGRLQQLLVDICLAASLGSLSPSLKSALQQLVAQFAANEGVLQLCRPLCCPILVNLSTIKLEEAPKELLVRLSTTLSRHCPFLGNVFVCLAHDDLNAAEKSMRTSLQALMASTAQVVDHQMTLLNARTPPSSASASPPISYTKSGTLYGASQCRTRPTYPHLNEGQDMRNSEKQARLEGADKGHQCRKFYDEYVKRQRTGGIMALWCTHCICVGFHVIPHAEGRNDVFSAIFSYWPRPPSVIVYDFACQLGPYSLRREAGFFKDTLFVVDQMHEKGHSDCSAASRLSTYMRNDPALQHLYSSAAECGNSGLSRIKKTVSFCNQEHAVALVRVFLCVWNRRKKLRMG